MNCALGAAMAVSAGTFVSCVEANDPTSDMMAPHAIVTVKQNNGNVNLQLDDVTVLYPLNMQTGTFEKEERAFVNYRMATSADMARYDAAYGIPNQVYVNWIEKVLTKSMSESTQDDDATYGNDPIEVLNSWSTVCEDGYLTLNFRTMYGGAKTHTVTLVKGEGDYEVVLHHDADGDTGARVGDGVVAFRLDKLPDTEGDTVDLKLVYNSFSGTKTVTFKYCTRKD